MIGHHFSISAFWNAASPSGVCCSREATSRPSSVKRAFTAGSASACDHRAVELGDDVLRRALRREEAEPARHVESRHAALVRGRNVRHRRRALRRQVGDRLDRAAAHLRQRHRALHHQQVDLSRDQVGHGRTRAAIGNEVHLRAGRLLHQDAGHLRRGVLVDELGFARIGLHPGDQLLEVVGRQVFLARPCSCGLIEISPIGSKSFCRS